MAISVELARRSRAQRYVRQIRDSLWPRLDRTPGNTARERDKPKPEVNVYADIRLVREAYARLSVDLEAEAERRRAVENKLLAIGSVAPLAVTIVVAAVSFLSSGRLRDLVPASVIVVSVLAFYVASQFLCAMLAAIRGLSAKSYSVPSISEIMPDGADNLSVYLRKACNELARTIEQHRETTNANVSQLSVAHRAMRNAVSGLLVVLFVLVVVVVWQVRSVP